jgi:hypothetical protein
MTWASVARSLEATSLSHILVSEYGFQVNDEVPISKRFLRLSFNQYWVERCRIRPWLYSQEMGVVWDVVRGEWVRRFVAIQAAHKEITQRHVAALGGIGQNDVSRIVSPKDTDTHGPSIEIFLGAIRGLGTTPPEFFTAVQPQLPIPDKPPPPWVLAALRLDSPSPFEKHTEEQYAQFGRWVFHSFWFWQASLLAARDGRPKKKRR